MKNAILIILFGFVILTLISLKSPQSNSYDIDGYDLLHNNLSDILPDSLHSIIKNKPYIVYISGHTAHIWSIIVKDGEKFSALSGRINAYGENIIYEPIESNLFDSAAFFSANREFLLWGVDSLPIKAHNMKPIKREEYNPIYTSLSIISEKSATYFDSNDAVAFAGPDSIAFNNKFKRLSLIMYWLAEPSIRPYIPDSISLYDTVPGTPSETVSS